MKEQLSLLDTNMKSIKIESVKTNEEDISPKGLKRCDTCKTHKTYDKFYKNRYKHDGLHSTCKECSKEITERRKHYKNLVDTTGANCSICGKDEKENGKKLSVDHCHKTGIIRGLLCNSCNSGIGNLNDCVDTMQKAIEYLKRHRE